MTKRQPSKQQHSVVLIGNFNPAIFQPSWFEANGMISQSQADNAQIQIIHPQAAVFDLDGIRLQILPERFTIETEQEKFDAVIRDLIIGTFSLLSHTPISMMGINRSMHYRLESTEIWHAVGHKLAPKDLWEGVLEQPGMRSLTMEGKKRDFETVFELLTVKIEPSRAEKIGLFFTINDHYEIKEKKDATGSKDLMDILTERWEDSYQHSKGIVDELLERLI